MVRSHGESAIFGLVTLGLMLYEFSPSPGVKWDDPSTALDDWLGTLWCVAEAVLKDSKEASFLQAHLPTALT